MDEETVPTEFTLQQNYPNPFNPSTTIRFGLPQGDYVKLIVYDMLGREVQRILEGPQTAGFHEVTLDAENLPSGTYLYRLETPARSLTRKFIVLK